MRQAQRPVFINSAAFLISDKGAMLVLRIRHLQEHNRIFLMLIGGHQGITFKKLLGGHPEMVLHAQDVVRRQEDIHIRATHVETTDLLVAAECESVILGVAWVIPQDLRFKTFHSVHRI
jgi:hypothetical protein